MSTLIDTSILVIEECCECHTRFAMSHALKTQRLEDKKNFYCPNGHGQHYTGKSEEERLTEQLAREKRLRGYTEATLTSTRDQLQATEYSLRSHKAAKTRIKNRIAAGVCPCCNRTFQNVAAHMVGQHPDFGHNTEESK